MAAKGQTYKTADPNDFVIIGRDTDPKEAEGHVLYDERALWPETEPMVANIMYYGILEPIRVRNEGGKLLVVDGRQRVINAREAKKRQAAAGATEVKVPYIETEGDDKFVGGVMLSGNEQRTDDNMLTKALKCARWMSLQGASAEDAAIAFGKSTTAIKGWLTLAKADSRVHDALEKNKISASAALQIAKMPKDEQFEALQKLVKDSQTERVSEAKARKLREETAAAAAAASETVQGTPAPADAPAEGDGKKKKGAKTAATKAATKPKKRGAGRDTKQMGKNRTWIRDALKTEAAKKLSDDQRDVLKWFAFGETKKGAWFDEFEMNVALEADA